MRIKHFSKDLRTYTPSAHCIYINIKFLIWDPQRKYRKRATLHYYCKNVMQNKDAWTVSSSNVQVYKA